MRATRCGFPVGHLINDIWYLRGLSAIAFTGCKNSVFLETFERRQRHCALEWGMTAVSEDEPKRPVRHIGSAPRSREVPESGRSRDRPQLLAITIFQKTKDEIC